MRQVSQCGHVGRGGGRTQWSLEMGGLNPEVTVWTSGTSSLGGYLPFCHIESGHWVIHLSGFKKKDLFIYLSA